MKVRKKQVKKDIEAIPTLEAQYEEIMKYFDFDKVSEFMHWDKSYREYDDQGRCVGKSQWKMVTPNKTFEVPSIDTLKQLASRLLSEVIEKYQKTKNDLIYIGTGPFKASCRYGILELDCVIEHWYYD